MGWFTIVGLLLILLSYFYLGRSSQEPKGRTMADDNRPLSSERQSVAELVKAGKLLAVEKKVALTGTANSLGPITRDFFESYSELQTVSGNLRLAVDCIQMSEYIHGYISVGNSEDWDIVVKPFEDEIFIVEGSEIKDADMAVRFRNIYHLIADECGSGEAGI
jgi:hypothetical protein